tara:strand:- start:1132 stop:1581 length:450 start_codon:yes stop_codon:yes gene_type:complete
MSVVHYTPSFTDCFTNKKTAEGTIFSSFRYIERVTKKRKASQCTLPTGCCTGDKTIFYDIRNNRFSTSPQEVSEQHHVLLVDGEGYKIGGDILSQHDARLQVHKRLCEAKSCKVVGCRQTLGFNAATAEQKCDYVRHFRKFKKRTQSQK